MIRLEINENKTTVAFDGDVACLCKDTLQLINHLYVAMSHKDHQMAGMFRYIVTAGMIDENSPVWDISKSGVTGTTIIMDKPKRAGSADADA